MLKNGRARAIRFSTLTAICQALDCQPGDILDLDRPESGAGKVPQATNSDLVHG